MAKLFPQLTSWSVRFYPSCIFKESNEGLVPSIKPCLDDGGHFLSTPYMSIMASPNRIFYFSETSRCMALAPFFLSYPTAIYTSWEIRYWPTFLMYQALMFLSLNLNNSTTERWTERLIFFISFGWKEKLYPVARYKKRPLFISTISLCLIFHLLTYTNPSTLMGAKQWVRALPLFVLSGFSGFYIHRTI